MGGAKNCPETPRQKMIGMMYLVLTAMLALNVSADILNGFTKLRLSMEGSMEATLNRTNDMMNVFETAYSQDGGEKKYGEWWAIAQAVKEASDDFYNYVEGFKLDIVNMIDKAEYTEMPDKIENNGDTNVPHQYALTMVDAKSGKINADEFKDRMDIFRRYITEAESPCLVHKIQMDETFAHNWDMKIKMMTDLFSTENSIDEEGKPLTWQESTFHEMPAGAVLALLTKYQSDIRVVENDLINFMYSAAGSSDFVVNQVTPVVLPTNGEYIMQGQKYRAKIASAMIDTNQVPRVFIEGVEYENGIYEASGHIGENKFEGYMLIGDDTTHYAFQGQYTVGAPGLSIQHKQCNVVFLNFDNKLQISVPGVAADAVSVTASSGVSIKKGAAGEYTLVVNDNGLRNKKITLNVSANVNGSQVSMGKWEYTVKKLPAPQPLLAINGKASSEKTIKLSTIKSYDIVVDNLDNVVDGISWSNVTYTARCGRKKANKIAQLAGIAKAGDVIKIEDVTAVDSQGRKTLLGSLAFDVL